MAQLLQRLCGRRAKRQQQEMQLIEVSGDAIMPDPNEWLTKQLTQEQETKIHSHSHRKNDGPTTQQRRKHQITYLAFQFEPAFPEPGPDLDKAPDTSRPQF
ncbi:hypothetical protein ANN_09766 [Periplaneta americana]|uniref:Uncharacterized protein n=1 Tax=Periplaneta americana TaxID=6978 RepID=A0ABQ8TN83_PERAM|nr:hypothetical protein ANN_09766 [Periplaneta americana]